MVRDSALMATVNTIISVLATEFIAGNPASKPKTGLYSRISARWLRLPISPIRAEDLKQYDDNEPWTETTSRQLRMWQSVAAYLCRESELANNTTTYLLPPTEIDALARHLAREFPIRLRHYRFAETVRKESTVPVASATTGIFPSFVTRMRSKENPLLSAAMLPPSLADLHGVPERSMAAR
ncbi:MAG: hypothetical protein SFU56_12105 [Capsulimonadales bacterium]|nr:hypothetical protein [Capsulimonadales bacterium]